MKSNKGVTLVALIVTIIVIIILSLVSIYYGYMQNTDKAIETKSVYEVYSVIDAVNNRTLLNKLNPDYYSLIGNKNFTTLEIDSNSYSADDGWYLVTGDDNFKELGLDNAIGAYLVNYDKGQVVSVKVENDTEPYELVANAISYKGATYYSLNDLKREMGGSSTILASVEYDETKKVNKPVLSDGMVPVKRVGGYWVVTTATDDTWYDYSREQSAWANVMLKDELALEGANNEEVRNMTISEMAGKRVVTEGSAYVWIPRYTTSSLSGSADIIFSNITSDTTQYDGKTYYLPSGFVYTQDGEEVQLPGIWMSKYEVGFDK